MKANAEHFFKDLEHCLKCKFTRAQAMVSSWLFSSGTGEYTDGDDVSRSNTLLSVKSEAPESLAQG